MSLDHLCPAVPANPRAHLGDSHQGFHRPRRPQLGEEADGTVDEQHHDDRNALGLVPENQRHRGGGGQEPDDHALELVDKDREHALGLAADQPVGAVRPEPGVGLRCVEATPGVRFQVSGHRIDGRGKRCLGQSRGHFKPLVVSSVRGIPANHRHSDSRERDETPTSAPRPRYPEWTAHGHQAQDEPQGAQDAPGIVNPRKGVGRADRIETIPRVAPDVFKTVLRARKS